MNWERIMCSSRYHVCAATLLLMMSLVCTDWAPGQDWDWWRENSDLGFGWRGADSRQWPRDNPEIMSRCEQLRGQISWQYSELRDKVSKLLLLSYSCRAKSHNGWVSTQFSDGAKQKYAFCPPSALIYVFIGSEKLLVYCWETVKPNSHHPWDSRYPDNQWRHEARGTCIVSLLWDSLLPASVSVSSFQTPDVTLDTRRMW